MTEPMTDMQYASTGWVEWWRQDQVVLTFHSPEPLEAGATRIIIPCGSINLMHFSNSITIN